MALWNKIKESIGLSKKAKNLGTSAQNSNNGRRRASKTIRKTTKRQVSYQIQDINTAINLARNPDTPDRSKLHSIYEYILRDARLKRLLLDTEMKVLSEPVMIYDADEKVDEERSKFYRKRWLSHIIKFIVQTELFGFSVIETDLIDPKKGNIGEVILIPREHISIERQWLLVDGTINGDYLPYGEIMHELDLLEFGRRDDFGLLLEAAYNIIWKYYSRSDWSRANEKAGMPILNVQVDSTNDDELDKYEDKAANFGSDGYIVTQQGDEVKFIERTGQNMHLTFLEQIKLCNDEATLLINGQTATTDQKAFVGSSEVQERKLEDITLARLQNVVEELNEKLVPYLQAKGFDFPEGYSFDYPLLVRERERKLNGQQSTTDPVAPTEEVKGDDKETKDKKQKAKQ